MAADQSSSTPGRQMKCIRTISGQALFPKPHTAPSLLGHSTPVACTRDLSALTPFRLDLLSPTGGHSSLYGIVTLPGIPLCRLFAPHYHTIPPISHHTLRLRCDPLNSTANVGYISDAAATYSEGSQPRTTYSWYPRGQERTPLESSQNPGLAQTFKNSGCHLRCWVC